MADLVPTPNSVRKGQKPSLLEFSKLYLNGVPIPDMQEFEFIVSPEPIGFRGAAFGRHYHTFDPDPWGVSEGRRGAVDAVVESVHVVSELRFISTDEIRPELLPVVQKGISDYAASKAH